MFLHLQVANAKDLLVLLKFGLMSDQNITSIKQINHLLQEGVMTQACAYKPAVPKTSTGDHTETASFTSSPMPNKKRAMSPAQNAAQRIVKPKSAPKNKKARRTTNGRQPVSAGGN